MDIRKHPPLSPQADPPADQSVNLPIDPPAARSNNPPAGSQLESLPSPPGDAQADPLVDLREQIRCESQVLDEMLQRDLELVKRIHQHPLMQRDLELAKGQQPSAPSPEAASSAETISGNLTVTETGDRATFIVTRGRRPGGGRKPKLSDAEKEQVRTTYAALKRDQPDLMRQRLYDKVREKLGIKASDTTLYECLNSSANGSADKE